MYGVVGLIYVDQMPVRSLHDHVGAVQYDGAAGRFFQDADRQAIWRQKKLLVRKDTEVASLRRFGQSLILASAQKLGAPVRYFRRDCEYVLHPLQLGLYLIFIPEPECCVADETIVYFQDGLEIFDEDLIVEAVAEPFIALLELLEVVYLQFDYRFRHALEKINSFMQPLF